MRFQKVSQMKLCVLKFETQLINNCHNHDALSEMKRVRSCEAPPKGGRATSRSYYHLRLNGLGLRSNICEVSLAWPVAEPGRQD